MKKFMLLAVLAAAVITVSVQAIAPIIEQFYTIKRVNKGTYQGSDFVGYLRSEDNHVCGATESSTMMAGQQACAVMKAHVPTEQLPTTLAMPYYRIVQASKGTYMPNVVGWMEDNSACGIPAASTVMMGAKGCAVIHANPYE